MEELTEGCAEGASWCEGEFEEVAGGGFVAGCGGLVGDDGGGKGGRGRAAVEGVVMSSLRPRLAAVWNGVVEGEADEGGHEEGFGGIGGGAEEQIDAGLIEAGVGGRGLGEDGVGVAGCVDVGEGAEFELELADVHGGLLDGLADDVGDGDVLGTEAFGDADLPAVADARAGCGGLGEDAADGDGGGVELVLDVEIDAGAEGGLAGFGDGHPGEVGDGDFVAVEGDAEGDAGGDEHDGDHRGGGEGDAEET